jgi:hypothetical protein
VNGSVGPCPKSAVPIRSLTLIKKITYHRDSALRPAPPRLPHASLSTVPPGLHLHRRHTCTATACSPREAAPGDCCCCLHHGHRVRPIVRDRTAACPLPSSFSTATAQPGFRCAVLRSPGCHVLLKAHVVNVCFECFRGILQMFQMDVAKVDQDVAYVTMIVHVYCKGLLPMFHLCFLDICYKCVVLYGCCIWLQWFSSVFRCFFFKCFKNMFQVFHLPSDVCCNCCIWMFQKQIGCCISPPRLLLHHLGVSSSRRRQGTGVCPDVFTIIL